MNVKKSPLFFPGTRIGPYSLVRELGKGTFGVVWLAERRGRLATTRVALKSPVGLNDLDMQFLIRESEVWIRSTGHPNVMPVIEAEEYDGCLVIVTEYAPEGSLETWLEKNGNKAPTVEAGVNLIAGILTGLGFLHGRGVIHRDLKPANILLQGGIPRITDFGLARLNHTSKHSYSVAGTPEYMAPEAWRGNRSVQSDLWSVGVMLYETLTGRSPFPTDNWDVLRQAVEFQEPARLPDSLPDHVKTTILTSLQKNPGDRFRSAEDMLAMLRGTAPTPAILTETVPPDRGSVDVKLHQIDLILNALEHYSAQPTSEHYIGKTLVKCTSFIEDHHEGCLAATMIEDLIGEVDLLERNRVPAPERVVSISKVRNLLRYFKQLRKHHLDEAQRMTATANYA